MTQRDHEKIKGDTRILERLIQKDQHAVKNIGDPAALMGVYDIEADITAQAIEQGQSPEAFNQTLDDRAQTASDDGIDLLALLMGEAPPPIGASAESRQRRMPSGTAGTAHVTQGYESIRRLPVQNHPRPGPS